MRLMFMIKRDSVMPSASSSLTAAAPSGDDSVSLPVQSALRSSFKQFWLRMHLYLGLFGGALFVLMSLTGSFLVFYKAIDEWLHPTQLTTTGTGMIRPLNEIVAVAQAAGPPRGWLDNIEFPSDDRDVFHAWHKAPGVRLDQFRWYQVTIDPYSGTVLGRDREWGESLVSVVYMLHASLLLDDLGETIVGFVAIALLLSIGTGVYLWWPSLSRIRRAFICTSRGSVIRRYYEWHKLSGFYSAIVLGMLAFTGMYLEFSEYVVPVVRLFSPVQEFSEEEVLPSLPMSGARPLPVEQAVARASQVFPEGKLRSISLPQGNGGVYQFIFRQPGEVRRSSGQSEVWLDQYSGAVIKVRDWRTFTAGDTFMSWLFPLHNGEAFGLIGRWIVFACGFVPLILYVTALRMWWLKRAAHRRQNQRAGT